MGATPDRIVLAGGGSRSRLWRQIIADLFGLPLFPLAIDEQSAYGAAILAATGGGVAELARAWARYDVPVEPDRGAHERYQELQSLFRELYLANASMFDQLAHWRANETGAAT
jgi:xylulokinase